MTARDFCYWLQGYFEIEGVNGKDIALNVHKVKMIQQHLSMVFVHEIDPSFPKEQQAALNEAHQQTPIENASDAFLHLGKKLDNGAIARC